MHIKYFFGFGFLVLHFLNVAAGLNQTEEFMKNMDIAGKYENIDTDSILTYTQAAYKNALDLGSPALQVDALRLIIKTHIKRGSNSAAFTFCKLADSISKVNGLEEQQIGILMLKGLVFQNSGLQAEGIELMLQAKSLMDNTQNFQYESELNYYLSSTYYSINEKTKSREFARKAINMELSGNDSSFVTKNYTLLASSFQNKDSIQKYLKLALEYSQLRRDDYKLAAILNNYALFWKAIGDNLKAKESYLKAIKLSVQNGYQKHLCNIYNNYAYLLMAEHKFDSAQMVLHEALTIARNLNNIDLEASVLDSYGDLFEKTGDYEQSLVYFRNSVDLRNKFKAQQQIEQSLFLSTAFETEIKEKQIAKKESQLYRTNVILMAIASLFFGALAVLIYFRQKSLTRKARIMTIEKENKLEVANALIEGQDAERKRLAMDLHDGISPKLGLLKLLVDSKLDEEKVYNEVNSSILEIDKDIRDISHRMLPSQLESKGLVVALENFIYLLNQNNKTRITFYNNLEFRLKLKYEINLFFIFYELINNALKHAMATEIIVQLLYGNDALSISVEDNGTGFDKNAEHTGIGLKNIAQRVTYLNGDLSLDPVIGEGTAIIIDIKGITL